MKRLSRAALLIALASTGPGLTAQDKDFLTTAEIEKLRVIQEIPERLQIYLTYAALRIDRLESTFKVEKVGRSGLIHDLLEEYGKIIEAIDNVTEDAFRKGRALESVAMVADAEKGMLAKLEAWREANPRDLARYEFVLQNAIDVTRDSIEINSADLKDRKRDALDRAVEEKKEREALMTPTAKEGAKQSEERKTEETEKTRKAPTLLRKGEKVGEKLEPKAKKK
jgi:hypothetical protein